MLVELVSKHIYLFVPTGKADELFVIKAKSIDEAGRNMSKPQELDVNMFSVLVYPLRSKGKDGHSAAAHIVSG